MGAGPYKFIKFENGTVNFEANENYFQGAPKTKYVNFLECISDDDKLNGVTTGTIDITDPSMSADTCLLYTSGGPEGPQAPHRQLPLPGPHGRGQDGALQVPGGGHVRR